MGVAKNVDDHNVIFPNKHGLVVEITEEMLQNRRPRTTADGTASRGR